MVKEVLVGDIHGNPRVFPSLDEILAMEKGAKRVFFMGDFSEGATQETLQRAANAAKKNPQQAQAVDNYQNLLEAILGKYKTREALEHMTPKDQAELNAVKTAFEAAVMPGEAAARYGPLNDAAGRVKRKHNAKFYGVAGNHDDSFIYHYLREIDLIDRSQSLRKERAIGARHTIEMSDGHVQTDGKYFIPPDDHDNLGESPVHQNFQNEHIDLIVSHKGTMLGELAKLDLMPMGAGLPALAAKNRCVEYCGHFHQGWVYRDPKTGVLSINPGTKHMMVVEREGNKVGNVRIYALGYDAVPHSRAA